MPLVDRRKSLFLVFLPVPQGLSRSSSIQPPISHDTVHLHAFAIKAQAHLNSSNCYSQGLIVLTSVTFNMLCTKPKPQHLVVRKPSHCHCSFPKPSIRARKQQNAHKPKQQPHPKRLLSTSLIYTDRHSRLLPACLELSSGGWYSWCLLLLLLGSQLHDLQGQQQEVSNNAQLRLWCPLPATTRPLLESAKPGTHACARFH
jgi:hypothetical protein